jgi:hypothetical protein
MKIAIGYRIQSGPWGGGNRFAVSLAKHIRAAGHDVVFDLSDADLRALLLWRFRCRILNCRLVYPSLPFCRSLFVYLARHDSPASGDKAY